MNTKLDEIFNNARKGMIPSDLWDKLERFPALKTYYENHYFIEKVEREHPKEIKILKDCLEESEKEGEKYFHLSKIFHQCLAKEKKNISTKEWNKMYDAIVKLENG